MKISKRVASLILSLLMLTSTVGVANANEATEQSDTVKPIYYDLSGNFNTSIFANENDVAPTNFTWGYNNSGYENNVLVTHRSGFSVGTKTDAVWWNNYSSQIKETTEENTTNLVRGTIVNSFSDNILTYKKEFFNLGMSKYQENVFDSVTPSADVPFKIGEMSATAKNAYSFENDNASVMFSGSGAVSQSLNFLFVTGRSNGKSWPKIEIKYADDTTDTHQFLADWANDGSVADAVNSDATYWGSNVYNQNKDLTLNGENKIVSDENGKSALRAIAFNTQNKVIKSVTVTANKRALVAVTEIPVSAEKYKELKGTEITTAWTAVQTNDTLENMKAIIAYDDEMKKCGISADDVIEEGATAKIALYRDIVSKTNTDPIYYDLSAVFNTSIFANVGDTVLEGSTWGYNDSVHAWNENKEYVKTEEYNGFSAESNGIWDSYTDKNSNSVVKSYNSETGIFTFAKDFVNLGMMVNGSTAYTSTAVTSDIPFEIGTNLSSSVNNAFAFNDKLQDSLNVTINGSKKPSQSLNLLVARGSGNSFQPLMNVKIKYTDGVEETKSVYVYGANNGSVTIGENKYDGWEVYIQSPDYKLSSNTIVINETTNDNRSALRALSIDTNGKAVEAVTVTSHNIALVAVTEIPVSAEKYKEANSEKINTAWNAVKASATLENMKAIIAYDDEMKASGIYADYILGAGADAQISVYRDIVSKIDTDPYYNTFDKNTSIFGKVSDQVTTWGYNDSTHKWEDEKLVLSGDTEYNGFSAESNDTWDSYTDKNSNSVVKSYNSENGIFTFAKGFVNLGMTNTDNTAFSAVTSDIPFNIGKALNSSEKNAFAFGDVTNEEGLSVTINGNKKPSQSLNFLVARGSDNVFSPEMKVKIKYTDGAEETKTVYVSYASGGNATVDNNSYGGWEVYVQRGDYKLSNGKIEAKEPNDNDRSALRALSIDTNGKAVESVTVESYNIALVAVTEVYQTYDEFIASDKFTAVKNAWEAVQTSETVANKATMVNYANELEKMGIPLIAIDSAKDDNGAYVIEKAVSEYKEEGSITWSYSTKDGTETGKCNVTVNVTNTTGKEQTYEIIVVAYTTEDCNKLADVNFETVTATSENVTKTLSVSKTDNIKVFVWDSFSSLKPVGEYTPATAQ